MLDRVPAAFCVALIGVFFVMSAVQLARSEEGIASTYGSESGSRRADGKPFHPNEIGCASMTLRLGSVHRVTNLATGRSIMCPINDRGPAPWTHRRIDLSVGAARALGVRGLARVRIQ